MIDKNWTIVAGVFILAMFFSAANWINQRIENDTYIEGKTTSKVKVEGLTHSLISALVAVLIFAGVARFYPDWGELLHGTIAVAGGALLGETLIRFAKRRVDNDNIIR